MSELGEKNKETVKELFSLLNKMGNDKDLATVLAEHLRTEHRTLQQSFWRVVKTTAEQYIVTADNHGTDQRNEQAVALAEEIADSNNYCPFI